MHYNIMDLPDPACEPDSFTSIMLGIDWIVDIEIQVFCMNFLAELKALRAELIQPYFIPLLSGTLPEREATKKERKEEYTDRIFESSISTCTYIAEKQNYNKTVLTQTNKFGNRKRYKRRD